MESTESFGGSSGYAEPVEPRVSSSSTTEYFVRHTSDVGSTFGPLDSERDARVVVDLLDKFSATLAKKPVWRAYKRTTSIEETTL